MTPARTISYIITQGNSGAGANNFVLMDNIAGFSNVTINGKIAAYQGSEKESIDSIKYQAPKSYSAQNRAVSKEDYITSLQQNNLGYSFDAVNVWGGQENDPPVYGQVFVCVKPQGSYSLTETQKQKIINDVLKPVSVMTVEPIMVDPDYTYLQLTTNVYYDPKKTTLTSGQIQDLVKTALTGVAQAELNTFNSTFIYSDFIAAVNRVDPSIITNEISLKIQKKIYPNLSTPTTYKLLYGVKLEKGMFQSGVTSSPSIKYTDPQNAGQIINGVYIEEIPSTTAGVDSISLINPGYSYQSVPTITILGDGSGATAEANIDSNGRLTKIIVTNPGSNYKSSPDLAIVPNTAIVTLGILGRMEIRSRGTGYHIGDKIEFINQIGTYGSGAAGNVKNVNVTGGITEVEFIKVPGQIIGGSGYVQEKLPRANVITSTGNGNVDLSK